jgi:FKBP-type peptidyl-prolyl cis-trans isomerase FklB
LRAAIAGKDPQMSLDEMAKSRLALDKLMLERLGTKNKQEGEKFLAKNKKREGVKTLKSGLQYEVLKTGKGGKSPKPTDTVTINYEGKLLDDQVFDSSYARRQPASLPVNKFIPGWTEALQLMKVGDKWRLFVPADLAYGDVGVVDPTTGREHIPPGSTLVFDLELLGINERGQPRLGQ